MGKETAEEWLGAVDPAGNRSSCELLSRLITTQS